MAGGELRDLAAQDGFQRVDALFQNLHGLESLAAQRVRPIGSQIVEQALVAALQFGARKRAGSDQGRLQIAVSQRDRQGSLALQHGLALIEAVRTPASGLSRRL